MNQSTERDFGNDENYKRLFAKQIYLYVLRQLSLENTWDKDTCKDLAYDITMEAITAVLAMEKSGKPMPENMYAYLMATVKNAIRRPKNIFNKKMRQMRIESASHNYTINFEANLGDVLILEASTSAYMEAYKSYDFIIHDNAFTSQQELITKLLNEGYNGKEIAEKLQLSESTISRAIAIIRSKMGGKDRP